MQRPAAAPTPLMVAAASTEQVAGTWRGSRGLCGRTAETGGKGVPRHPDGRQRERFVRNQFVQEMPQSVDDALCLATKQHTVEEAQRRLRQRKHGGDVEAVVAVDSEEIKIKFP